MLAHCLIDDIYLPVFENNYNLVTVLLCLFVIFFKFILSIFWRTTLGTSVLLCALMCLSSESITYMLISLFAYASNTNLKCEQ